MNAIEHTPDPWTSTDHDPHQPPALGGDSAAENLSAARTYKPRTRRQLMARDKIQNTTPNHTTYHLAERLKGLAIDSLYRFNTGWCTLSPIDGHTVTALLTSHT